MAGRTAFLVYLLIEAVAHPVKSAPVKEQLLLYQFLNSLPHKVSKQLRAMRVMKTFTEVVERAKIPMTVELYTLTHTTAA